MNSPLKDQFFDRIRSRGSNSDFRAPFQVEEVVYARREDGEFECHSRRPITKWLSNNDAQNTLAETIAFLRAEANVTLFPGISLSSKSNPIASLHPDAQIVDVNTMFVMKMKFVHPGRASQFDAWLRPRDVKTGAVSTMDAYPAELVIVLPPGALHGMVAQVRLREALIVEWKNEFTTKIALMPKRLNVSQGIAL